MIILVSCSTTIDNDDIHNKIIESLTLDVDKKTVYEDFELPKSIIYERKEYDIVWNSQDEKSLNIVENNDKYIGKITRSDVDKIVSFTASITYEDITKTKEFSVTIGKLDSEVSTGDLPSDVTYTGYYADMTGMFGSYDDFFNTLNSFNSY